MALNERHGYFIGKDDTLQFRLPTKISKLVILPAGTNFDFAKLIFNLEISSKGKNKVTHTEGYQGHSHTEKNYCLHTKDEIG